MLSIHWQSDLAAVIPSSLVSLSDGNRARSTIGGLTAMRASRRCTTPKRVRMRVR